jgi:hypothetical protein
MNPNDIDNHVVVMAWIPEDGKWILLDPSFNAYLADSEGHVLSPAEIREKIAAGETMKLNRDANMEYIH